MSSMRSKWDPSIDQGDIGVAECALLWSARSGCTRVGAGSQHDGSRVVIVNFREVSTGLAPNGRAS